MHRRTASLLLAAGLVLTPILLPPPARALSERARELIRQIAARQAQPAAGHDSAATAKPAARPDPARTPAPAPTLAPTLAPTPAGNLPPTPPSPTGLAPAIATPLAEPGTSGGSRSFGELSDEELIAYAAEHVWTPNKGKKHIPAPSLPPGVRPGKGAKAETGKKAGKPAKTQVRARAKTAGKAPATKEPARRPQATGIDKAKNGR